MTIKILYTTDLHGNSDFYNLTWLTAKSENVDVVINGGDMLPKQGGDIFDLQPKFIRDLQNHYFPKFEKAGIHYLCFLGNDDLRIFDDMFDEACSQFEFVHNLPQRKVEIDGYEFVGFNLVADYPFRLKDRCRMDHKDFVFPRQFGPGLYTTISNPKGFETVDDGVWEDIEDWISHAQTLPTIEDELEALVRPKDKNKAIYIIHMPPAGLGLDHCMGGDRPGSKAVLKFLEKEQPLLSLHGHIHESPSLSGKWKVQVGNTWAVQPGQGGMNLMHVIIDTDWMAWDAMDEGFKLNSGIERCITKIKRF